MQLGEGVLYTHCAPALLCALQMPWLQTISTVTSNLATCAGLEGGSLCFPWSPETIAMDMCSENHRKGIITMFSKEETEAHRGEGAPKNTRLGSGGKLGLGPAGSQLWLASTNHAAAPQLHPCPQVQYLSDGG